MTPSFVTSGADAPLVAVSDLCKHFIQSRKLFSRQPPATVRAVDGVSFAIRRGETLGIVGESGCGKSTTGRMLIGLIEPTRGTICFEGVDLAAQPPGELRRSRRDMGIVFQDPFSSLNPRMKVGAIIGEPLTSHRAGSVAERRRRVLELLDVVGLPRTSLDRYPHEFSGGQRQRIGIARALALKPKFIVCDEAVSALDVSIQAQIVNLLQDLQRDFGLTYLFISHNLSVVRHIAGRIGVMYLGKLVEVAPTADLFANPRHPYTQALLSAIPSPRRDGGQRQRIILQGDVPTPLAPPPGCRFHTRCPLATGRCRNEVPEMKTDQGQHQVACHLAS